MIYLIGLGLNDETDLSIKAIDAIKHCDIVYVETYTNDWKGNIEEIEKITGKKVEPLKREQVESDFLIKKAKTNRVALLVPGDPLTATTHFSLLADAKKDNVKFEIIHSSSIYTAVAETGLQLYKFGRTTTLPMPKKGFKPASPIEIIRENKKNGLHSLVLLDIDMTAKEGLDLLAKSGFLKEMAAVCCNLGGRNRTIRYGIVSELLKEKGLDVTPAAIVLPGKLHFTEEEALQLWR